MIEVWYFILSKRLIFGECKATIESCLMQEFERLARKAFILPFWHWSYLPILVNSWESLSGCPRLWKEWAKVEHYYSLVFRFSVRSWKGDEVNVRLCSNVYPPCVNIFLWLEAYLVFLQGILFIVDANFYLSLAGWPVNNGRLAFFHSILFILLFILYKLEK